MKSAIAYTEDFLRHITPPGHPETMARASVIYEALKALDHLPLTVREATVDEIALCHTPEYIQLVRDEVAKLPNIPGKIALAYLSTGDAIISPDSYEVACKAVGAALVAVDAVLEKRAKNAFCIVRPPGHHASQDRGMGFCLFNNVAIACRYAQKKFGIKRALIVDWDLHHGNGTEDIFRDDPTVFYFSTHQAKIYPGTGTKSTDHILNCPVPAGAHSKEAIFDAFKTKLVPLMQKFSPECVFISCGFDGHKDDPLGHLQLLEHDFAALTQIVKRIANGKVISVLEGGYSLSAIRASALAHFKSLMEEN